MEQRILYSISGKRILLTGNALPLCSPLVPTRPVQRLRKEAVMMVSVGALFFDLFGTLVDWRTSIAREAEVILKPLGCTLDWLAFADAWRGEYQGRARMFFSP
jgi:hypothetical protein